MGKKSSKAHKLGRLRRHSAKNSARRPANALVQRVGSDSDVHPWVKLSGCVGDFIRYWGFRRIHGEIWTQLFLSAQGLTGTELARRLRVSKALVSPALVELELHGLICLEKTCGRERVFVATGDVFSVIKKILLSREVKMVAEARSNYQELLRLSSQFANLGVDEDRARELGRIFDFAQLLLQAASSWPVADGFKGAKR